MAAADAGVQVPCPGCGATVLQKAMIPLLGSESTEIRYLCPACARQLIDTAQTTAPQTTAASAS